MADQASPQLVWQLVKNNNCYLRRNVNNTWFSTERGNLSGRNSYKHSGALRRSTAPPALMATQSKSSV